MKIEAGFLGAGNMARAIIHGLLHSGYAAGDICVCGRREKSLTEFAERGVHTTTDRVMLTGCTLLIVAVKPWQIAHAVSDMPIAKQTIVISLAAGVRVAQLQKYFPDNPLIRVMPNTPVAVGSGISALYAPVGTAYEQVEDFFRRLGMVYVLENEEQMHAITALSGSGPGYCFYLMQCLENAAIQLGIDNQESRRLVAHTLLGSAQLALQSDEQFAELCARVVSKGGTTQAALDVFEKQKTATTIASALRAAHMRSRELGD